jgi:tetratricopeptide (TPR) repeat protein
VLPIAAGAPKPAVELAARAAESYGRGDYAGALGAFSEAHRLSGDPSLLFDTGLCHYMLGHPQEALQLLQLYVDRAPKSPARPQADALIAQLHRQLGNDE